MGPETQRGHRQSYLNGERESSREARDREAGQKGTRNPQTRGRQGADRTEGPHNRVEALQTVLEHHG